MKETSRELKLSEFSRLAGIPYSTLMTVFKRDVSGAGFDLMMTICRTLDFDPKTI